MENETPSNLHDVEERVVQRISLPSFVKICELSNLPCMSLIPHRATVNKREKKGPRSAEKESKIYCIKFLEERQISLRGFNTMAKKRREIKVHFIFDIAGFGSARRHICGFLILYPQH